MRRTNLKVVRNDPPQPAEPPKELGLYAETRTVWNDLERWRRVHETADRAPAVTIAGRMRRLFALGGGTRRERGGHKFEERA